MLLIQNNYCNRDYMKFLIQFIIVSHLLSNPAYAYLDPGTGSVILQALIAFFAGVAAFISLYWRKLKSFISNMFSKVKKK